ncbi:DUF58 domain-containing protein [Marinihelvus fidelis]|uniref:DUF58 domain-containing protein n=1 Tax=Marinihelvus fidelis TaxID=2613842 RepID=A0A5N0T9K5_9GAMM|nr:DUF58 domain-containing protein [Marinihelvus fidelis]KAA9131451.1 DUF58 domain-containing protein [Marinihelvus fidelis]
MERFIDPKTLARVRDLPLVARTVAEGFLHGIQPSHQRGVGIEFSQYRSYEPGDDPARIDWKLYARSDRYFVREAERESEIGTWFVIDCSQSMAQRSEDGAWSKFDYARHLVAALSWIAHRQGDPIGLLALNAGESTILPLATGERQWHRLLTQLHGLETGDRFPDANLLGSHLARLQSAGLAFIISDFHQVSDEIYALVRRIANARNEVDGMQLLCADETRFPWRGPVRFEDLETGETVLVSGRAARDTYLAALDDYNDRLRAALGGIGVSLDSFDIDQPLDAALHHYLQRRLRMPR